MRDVYVYVIRTGAWTAPETEAERVVDNYEQPLRHAHCTAQFSTVQHSAIYLNSKLCLHRLHTPQFILEKIC